LKRIGIEDGIMTRTSTRIFSLVAVTAGFFLLAGVLLFLVGCKGKEDPAGNIEDQSHTFTFFGLGPSTGFSNDLRDNLRELLGNGGVETRTTIDLTMGGVEDFSVHFPRLQELHDALNYLPRQRLEHDTVQLTYRYARQQSVPFDRIQLVFSGERKTPLFFSLYSKRDGADFIESIRKKHGEPRTIGDDGAAGRTLFWRKDNAILLISVTRNRIGFNEYNFGIYYLDNLAALVDAEKAEREAAEREKEKTGELAF
jgi:hypothetical protein